MGDTRCVRGLVIGKEIKAVCISFTADILVKGKYRTILSLSIYE